MLRVTAIIPTCGRPLLLARALRSVVAQRAAPSELIVVLDGERREHDAVRRVVDGCGFAPALLVKNSHAPGVSGARNTGADLANGDLLAFLDDDDEWSPEYLLEAVERFKSQALDVMCTDLMYRFEKAPDRPGKSAPDRLSPEQFLTTNRGLIGSNLIIRRSLYRDIGGFDESLRAFEDMDFGLRLSIGPEVKYAPLRKRLVSHYHHVGPRSMHSRRRCHACGSAPLLRIAPPADVRGRVRTISPQLPRVYAPEIRTHDARPPILFHYARLEGGVARWRRPQVH